MTGYVLRHTRTGAYRAPGGGAVDVLADAAFWRAKEAAARAAAQAGAVWRVHLVTYTKVGEEE